MSCICFECGKVINGEAFIFNGNLYHKKCYEKYKNRMNGRGFMCPKCKGSGVLRVKYNAYPSGLPDSGWVEDWKYKKKTCIANESSKPYRDSRQ